MHDALGIDFGRVRLPSFVTVASGPLTDRFDKIEAAAAAGAGALSIKLTFARVPFTSQMRSYSSPGSVIISPTNRRLDRSEAVSLIARARERLDLPILANLTAPALDLQEWADLGLALADAGADVLEPNFCCPNLSTSTTSDPPPAQSHGALIGEDARACASIVERLRSTVDVPVVPKIVPGTTASLLTTAARIEQAGAHGIHVVGPPLSGLPPLREDGSPDIPLLYGVAPGSTNGPVSRYPAYLYTAQLARQSRLPIMTSGGLETWKHCVDAVSWGATAVALCSAFMWYGFDVLADIHAGVRDFLQRNRFRNIADVRGRALRFLTTPDRVEIRPGTAVIDLKRCTRCMRCTRPAHCDAIRVRDQHVEVLPEHCIGCGICAGLCPVQAITYRDFSSSGPTPE